MKCKAREKEGGEEEEEEEDKVKLCYGFTRMM